MPHSTPDLTRAPILKTNDGRLFAVIALTGGGVSFTGQRVTARGYRPTKDAPRLLRLAGCTVVREAA